MQFGRSFLQRESLLRVSGEERSQEILISFHSSGSTSNQWRKLKNPWFPGRTSFRPSCCGTGKKKRFFAQLAHSAGPTCISYLAGEASDRLEFLPSWDSMDHDLLSLVGQYRSTLVDHMDVEKASDLDELETSLFHFYLPSSYLCFVCSREEFEYCESRLVPENALPLELGFQILTRSGIPTILPSFHRRALKDSSITLIHPYSISNRVRGSPPYVPR